MAQTVDIKLIPGNVAPRYTLKGQPRVAGVQQVVGELKLETVVITERGMQSGFPLLDLQLRAPNGDLYFAVVTGEIANMISSAVKGVNMRNHGVEHSPGPVGVSADLGAKPSGDGGN